MALSALGALIAGLTRQAAMCPSALLAPAPALLHAVGAWSRQVRSAATSTSPETSSADSAAAGPADASPSASAEPAPAASSAPQGASFGSRQVTRRGGALGSMSGIVFINNTRNNIFIHLLDLEGRVRATRSAGTVGFRNARKSQPAAAERVAQALAREALQKGYSNVVVRMKGVGDQKYLATRVIHATGLRVTELQEVTSVPHNGCRLRKRRRV